MAENEIKLLITGRHLDVGDHVRDYIEEKINKLKRYFEIVNEAHVVLTHEKYRYLAEITLVATNGMSFSASDETNDLILSIDNAFEVLKRQVRKKKEKKYDSKRHRGAERGIEVHESEDMNLMPADGGDEPRIIRTREYDTKPMTLDEAALQMKSGKNKKILVFMNSITDRVNVLYSRDDGNFGLIEPDFR